MSRSLHQAGKNGLGKPVTGMPSRVRTPAVAAVAVAIIAVTSAGCSRGGLTSRPEGTTRDDSTLLIAHKSGPDYLDPALSYKASGWEPLWVCYTPLLTYNHAPGSEGARLIPGLGEALPEVSTDGKTYTVRLRPNLVYSDGSPVKATDFGHSIYRMLRLASQGAANFEDVEGVSAVLEENKKPEVKRKLTAVSGISADDATGVIKITLTKPNVAFPHVLAMPFGSLVPASTPIKNLTASPPPGVGAFKITKHDPRREFVVERNDRFDVPGLPKAQIGKIACRIIDNDAQMTQDVMADRLDYMLGAPAVSLRQRVRNECGGRYKEHVTPSTQLFCMNSTRPPFSDVRVRQAVGLAIDRERIAGLYGGLLQPGKTFLPPGVPGHDPEVKVGRPKLLQAQKLIRAAGAAETEVLVFGNLDSPESTAVCEYLAGVLNELGLKAKLQLVQQYYEFIGNKGKMKEAAFIAHDSWFMDYPLPSTFFFLVHGRTIQDEGNQNRGMVNDNTINEEFDRLAALPEPNERAWAALDRYLVDDMAYLVPFGSEKSTTFLSSRMDTGAAYYHLIYQHDYTSFRLKN